MVFMAPLSQEVLAGPAGLAQPSSLLYWSGSLVCCQVSFSGWWSHRSNCCLYTCAFDFAHRRGEFSVLLCCRHLGPLPVLPTFKSVFSMNSSYSDVEELREK